MYMYSVIEHCYSKYSLSGKMIKKWRTYCPLIKHKIHKPSVYVAVFGTDRRAGGPTDSPTEGKLVGDLQRR